jgi:sec-independent protein translocase protein TatB
MFGMSAWHLAVLVVVGLFVFGPERLPTMIRDLGAALRQVRAAAQTMQDDLKSELGPEVGDLDLRSLHPQTFVKKHLFGDEEDPLGLDFLRKDAEPLISFNKPIQPEEVEAPPHAEPAYEPPAYEPDSGGSNTGLGKVKYDLDAT